MRFDLTGEEWAQLDSLVPISCNSTRADDHRIVSAAVNRDAMAGFTGVLRPNTTAYYRLEL
jgi:hypothetical protein